MVVFGLARGLQALLLASLLHGFMSEASGSRKETDETVIASLRDALEHLTTDAHTEDAVINVALGPAEPAFASFIDKHLPHYPTLRGRKEIKSFFDALRKAGVKFKHPLDEEGRHAADILVVNDGELILSGRFTSPEMSGRVLSETWIRPGGEGNGWKIRTGMYIIDTANLKEIEAVEAGEATPAPDAPAASTNRELPNVEDEDDDGPSESEMPSSKTPSPTTPVQVGGHSLHILGLTVTGTVFIAAFFYFAHRRHRKSAQWRSINTAGDVWLG